MPLYTKNYNLVAFTWNDVYSSTKDESRFVSIDNEMAFISDQIGNGVISGWDIIDNENGSITISPGIGMIGRNIVETSGEFTYSLSPNSTHYIYMREKELSGGGLSGNSNIESFVAVDTIPPSSPTGSVQVIDILSYLASLSDYGSDLILYLKNLMGIYEKDDNLTLIDYSQIAFKWNNNTEPDFSHYIIKKAVDIEYGVYEEIGTTSYTIYVDSGLSQNTSYTYQVIAVDVSGNESDPLEFTLFTEIDTRVPANPIFVQAFPGNEQLEIIWDHSPSDNIASYRVDVQPLNDLYESDGSSIESIINITNEDFGSTYAIVTGLENNKKYKVTVYSVTNASIESSGVSVNTEILYSAGAGEISTVEVEFPVSSFENVGIETHLLWTYSQNDPYLEYANKFIITFVENGTRFSEPIEILENAALSNGCVDINGQCYGLNIRYIPFNNNGKIEYESIKEYTPYFIIIQTADLNENVSSGIIKRIDRTPVSSLVSSISNLSIDRKNDNSIFLKWTNPTEQYFSYNLLTIKIVNLADEDFNPSDFEEETYLLDKRVDKSETFVIPSSEFNVNYRYHIEFKSYDVFDNQGGGYEIFKQFLGESTVIYPDPPSQLTAEAGDTIIHLKWNYDYDNNPDSQYFKIYRADFSYYLSPSDFSAIAIIPSSNTFFDDYFVSNYSGYSYFVNTVDIYGNESISPSEEVALPSITVSATPNQKTTLTPPSNLSIQYTENVDDIQLNWDASTGTFDGYEILRSDENKYSFNIVGYVPVSQTSFIDENVPLKNGATYYYAIRKYTNDSNLYVESTPSLLDGIVLIGKVVVSNGLSVIDIDTTVSRKLLNFEDPIIEKTIEKINTHNHKYEYDVDRRIELRSNVIITDWTTLDYQTYSTNQDIEGADSYIIHISGELNEDYFKDYNGNVDASRYQSALSGESPVIYEIDVDSNTLIFNEIIYTTCVEPEDANMTYNTCPSVPYKTEPLISLELLNISEVDNDLGEDSIESLSATQIETGQIDYAQMPEVNHDGRKNESLVPLKLLLKTNDNFLYELSFEYDEGRNNIGSAATFYDIIEGGNNGELLAATSNGILYSNDDGNGWVKVSGFSAPVHRLYKSYEGAYYALTSNRIYKLSGDSYRSWSEMSGLYFVKSIRDITEDTLGNLYLSTDLGVYKLNSENLPYIEDSWQQLSIFGSKSSEAYAIFYDEDYIDSDSVSGRIIVSNELGLLQSTDSGLSWVYTPELESNIKIRKFRKYNNFIFALGDNSLYREQVGGSQFEQVSEFGSSLSRSMEIYGDKIYIGTDIGPLVSLSSDIYSDTDIEFISVWSKIKINNKVIIVTTINKIGDHLFIGADRLLYIYDGAKLWKQYEQKGTVVPTFFVNSIIQNLGFYYNNGISQNVSFDESIPVNSVVEVSNKYDIYYAEYGGWVSNKFDAKFKVYKNSIYFGESEDSIAINKSNFSSLVLPSYTDLNAHKIKADEYKTQLEIYIDNLIVQTSLNSDDLRNLVSSVYNYFELFLSQIYEEARYVVDENGLSLPFTLPSIDTQIIIKRDTTNNQGEIVEYEVPVYDDMNQEKNTDYTTSVNVVNGMFKFDLPFDRYDALTVDIYGVTLSNAGEYNHREIEDLFEDAYSGFTSYLSQVQQINLLKLGIFSERTWPGQQENYCPLTYSQRLVPTPLMSYDILNSTINYTEEIVSNNERSSLSYPSAVAYIPVIGKIFVGGWECLFSIDVNNFNIEKIEIGDLSGQLIRAIFVSFNDIYVVSDKDIFLSSNGGETWEEYDSSGLPNQLYSIGKINNNLLVGAKDGIYIRLIQIDSNWEKVIDSNEPVSIIESSNVLFTIINGLIYRTSNGYSYSNINVGGNLDITDIKRHNYTTTYVSSVQGLYSDNGSFNGKNPSLSKIDMGVLVGEDDTINDVFSDGSIVIAGISNGAYAVIRENNLRVKEFTSLPTIHKCLIINNEIWLFSGDRFKTSSLDYPVKISTGAPL